MGRGFGRGDRLNAQLFRTVPDPLIRRLPSATPTWIACGTGPARQCELVTGAGAEERQG